MLTEARARTALRAGDDLESWLAEQPWRALEDGSWHVEVGQKRWTFRIEAVPSQALRVVVQAASGSVTAWLLEARRGDQALGQHQGR